MHLSKDFFLTAAHMLDVSSLGGGWPKETYVGPSSWKHVKRKFNVQLLDFFHNFFSTWYINWYWTICNPVWKLHLYKKKLIKIQILKNPPRCSQSFRSSPPSMSTVLPAWMKESLFLAIHRLFRLTWWQCHSTQALDSFSLWWRSARWKRPKPR